MNVRPIRAALLAAAIFGFAPAIGFAQDAVPGAAAQESSQDASAQDAKSDVVSIRKDLPGGGTVEIVKVGREPATATLDVDGKKTTFEAYDPISTIPEAAREIVRDEWAKLGEFSKRKIDIEIDVSEAPDAKDWAERAQSRVEYWYPKVVAMLDGDEAVDKIPEDFKIRLVFKPFDGVAYAAGREITVSSEYIKKRPKDFGLAIHETTHVAQAYPRVREVWAMEGMTDYIRYFITEPRDRNNWRVDPERSKYTDSYGVTATFFDWIVREKDPEFIQKIHRAFRSRQKIADLCEREYGATLDDLWRDFIASL